MTHNEFMKVGSIVVKYDEIIGKGAHSTIYLAVPEAGAEVNLVEISLNFLVNFGK